MSAIEAVVLGALGALVVLHMARPRFLRQRLSSARFFVGLPPAEDRRRRFALGNPLRSRPLYPQLVLVALLAGALLSSRGCERRAEPERLGLWVLVDTSYSMTTVQEGRSRLAAARDEVRRFLDRADAVAEEPPCLRISAFDLELRPARPEPLDRAALEGLLAELEIRALGTDLTLLRTTSPAAFTDDDAACPVHYRLAVTDLPAPDWAGEPGSGWIWRDVGRGVDNAGLVRIEAARGPFGGPARAIAVEAAAYGTPPIGARLEMSNAEGTPVAAVSVDWPETGAWRGELPVPGAGRYHLRLEPGGAYAGDDEATIDLAGGTELRVDWRLPDPGLVERFGWRRAIGAGDADLSVLALGTAPPADHPALVVGNHYRRRPGSRIGFFEPDSPLLDGLNFDVAESAGIEGVAAPPGFVPVLAGGGYGGEVWVARRDDPPGVYLPGLPTGTGDPLGHFSATLFVQALRWLLAETRPPPLYTLTSPARPEPEGSRIALHDGEGKTDQRPLSRGDLGELRAVVREAPRTPSWPWWLAAAAAVFLGEQLLMAYGGEGWR